MKFTCEVIIDLPCERTIELFDDVNNLKKWMIGLESFEHLSGEPGHPGAQSHLLFNEDGRKLEMTETITVRNLPDEFSGIYETRGVKNIAINRFINEGAEKTRWVAEHEFQFNGIMKLMGLLMRGAFPKQTKKYMMSCKDFAEEEKK
jgi:hypothetical protein